MSIPYKPIPKVVGVNKELLYYPSIVKSRHDVIYTKEIARELAKISSMDEGSVFSMLVNLRGLMHHYLGIGKTVHLEGIGSFRTTFDCTGQGVDSPEKVNSKQINKVNVVYTPEYTKDHTGKHRCALTDGFICERSNLYPWPRQSKDSKEK